MILSCIHHCENPLNSANKAVCAEKNVQTYGRETNSGLKKCAQ
jgi:hypothetical protein